MANKYYEKNRGSIRRSQNEYGKKVRRDLRLSIFNILGFECNKCGFKDTRALQIDHVNGGGGKERKGKRVSSISYFKSILSKVMEGSKEYQILCANCNWIKRSEENEQPYFIKTNE